jgi:hypothetical protein
MEKIDALQRKLDVLSGERAKYIRQYDAAPDGSQAKREAVAALDDLNSAVLLIEEELSILVDALPKGE